VKNVQRQTHVEEDAVNQKRRDFLKAGGGALICTCAGVGVGVGASGCAMISGTSSMPAVLPDAARVSDTKLVIDLARVPALAVVGGSAKWVPAGSDKKVIIVRSGHNQFEAFINRCTHAGKELEYLHDEKKLQCVSFGSSEFDLEGRRLSGPAKGDLAKLAITRIGDSLEILL
jgi:cytochrome b6-f complex iron-sulfur subunit